MVHQLGGGSHLALMLNAASLTANFLELRQGEVQYCPDLFDLGSGCSGAHSFGIVRKNRG
jgi:hypothetical protein